METKRKSHNFFSRFKKKGKYLHKYNFSYSNYHFFLIFSVFSVVCLNEYFNIYESLNLECDRSCEYLRLCSNFQTMKIS